MLWLWCVLSGASVGYAAAELTRLPAGLPVITGSMGACAGLFAVRVLGFHVHAGYAVPVSGLSAEIISMLAGASLSLLLLFLIKFRTP